MAGSEDRWATLRPVRAVADTRPLDATAAGSPGQAILTGSEWRRVAKRLRLSPRETELVRGAFDDEKESAMAGRLGISCHTVHTHFERIYRKLHVHSRPQLLLRVLGAHLLRNG